MKQITILVVSAVITIIVVCVLMNLTGRALDQTFCDIDARNNAIRGSWVEVCQKFGIQNNK